MLQTEPWMKNINIDTVLWTLQDLLLENFWYDGMIEHTFWDMDVETPKKYGMTKKEFMREMTKHIADYVYNDSSMYSENETIFYCLWYLKAMEQMDQIALVFEE